MLIVAYWCLLMLIDASWWLLMLLDAYWCLLMLIDAYRCLLAKMTLPNTDFPRISLSSIFPPGSAWWISAVLQTTPRPFRAVCVSHRGAMGPDGDLPEAGSLSVVDVVACGRWYLFGGQIWCICFHGLLLNIIFVKQYLIWNLSNKHIDHIIRVTI